MSADTARRSDSGTWSRDDSTVVGIYPRLLVCGACMRTHVLDRSAAAASIQCGCGNPIPVPKPGERCRDVLAVRSNAVAERQVLELLERVNEVKALRLKETSAGADVSARGTVLKRQRDR